MPRFFKRQTNRLNFYTYNTEDRISILIPLLDNIIVDLMTRFSQNIFKIFQLFVFLSVNF